MDEKRSSWVLSIGTMLVGIWLGCRLRETVTGEPAQAFVFEYVDDERDRRYRSVPVSSKLWPALLLTGMGRWRPLNGFLAGAIIGGFVDDRFEAALVRWISARARGRQS